MCHGVRGCKNPTLRNHFKPLPLLRKSAFWKVSFSASYGNPPSLRQLPNGNNCRPKGSPCKISNDTVKYLIHCKGIQLLLRLVNGSSLYSTDYIALTEAGGWLKESPRTKLQKREVGSCALLYVLVLRHLNFWLVSRSPRHVSNSSVLLSSL